MSCDSAQRQIIYLIHAVRKGASSLQKADFDRLMPKKRRKAFPLASKAQLGLVYIYIKWRESLVCCIPGPALGPGRGALGPGMGALGPPCCTVEHAADRAGCQLWVLRGGSEEARASTSASWPWPMLGPEGWGQAAEGRERPSEELGVLAAAGDSCVPLKQMVAWLLRREGGSREG